MILTAILLAVPPSVSVTDSAGTEVQGTWQAVTAEAVVVGEAGAEKRIPLTELSVLRTGLRPVPLTDVAARVTLVDGSFLPAQEIAPGAKKDALEVTPAGAQDKLQLPLKAVRWIRFGNAIGEIADQWQRLIATETPTDLLVVRRASGALDQVSGVVLSIEGKAVQFDMEGQTISAPRERLEGIIFKTTNPKLPASKFEVADIFGATWRCAKIDGADGATLKLETPGGVSRTLGLDQIERLAAEGNVAYLATQAPAAVTYEPDFPTPLGKEAIAKWLGPGPVDRSLRLVAPCRIEYRVPDGFQRFQCSIAVDPEVIASGGCELVVFADAKELARVKIDELDLVRPLAIDLTNQRRLVFELKPAAGGAYGDWVLLKDARFLP